MTNPIHIAMSVRRGVDSELFFSGSRQPRDPDFFLLDRRTLYRIPLRLVSTFNC